MRARATQIFTRKLASTRRALLLGCREFKPRSLTTLVRRVRQRCRTPFSLRQGPNSLLATTSVALGAPSSALTFPQRRFPTW